LVQNPFSSKATNKDSNLPALDLLKTTLQATNKTEKTRRLLRKGSEHHRITSRHRHPDVPRGTPNKTCWKLKTQQAKLQHKNTGSFEDQLNLLKSGNSISPK